MRALILVLIIGALILVLAFSLVAYKKITSNSKPSQPFYQGPVPEGYDEEYFRLTGVTKLLEVKK